MTSLSAGTRLGPYEIVAPIGAGGMGEVYKARDTRLNRVVAIKVSKDRFSDRFEREAHAVAALNHPHICQLYDVGPDYLVMEYVEGQALKGPLPIEQALKYGVQICDALDAAHRKGITHRDLKPANILVTKAGIKILDFGLAKIDSKRPVQVDETVTQAITKEGSILGTLQYMSPEQVQGKEADSRSDIFSFGCVPYEMLTGKRAFDGANAASLIAAILERPAPSVTPVAPPALDRVLQKCLAKDPDERWQSAHDLGFALAELTKAEPSPQRKGPRFGWAVAMVALGVMALIGWVGVRFWPGVSTRSTQMWKLSMQAPFGVSPPEISPDGSAVLMLSTGSSLGNPTGQLLLRRLDSLKTVVLANGVWRYESWSPDGASVVFLMLGEGSSSLKKMRLTDGAPETLATFQTSGFGGASWGRGGVILFSSFKPEGGGALFVVGVNGGQMQELAMPGFEGGGFYHPEFLPNGEDFLFTWISHQTYETGVYLAGLRNGRLARQPMLLRKAEGGGRYSAAVGGQLLFVDGDNLYAQRLNIQAARLEGEPRLVVDGIFSVPVLHVGNFSVSSSGTVVWRPGKAYRSQLTWFDRTGRVLSTTGPPGNYLNLRISPNGSRVATGSANEGALVMNASERGGVRIPRAWKPLWLGDDKLLAVPDYGIGSITERSVTDLTGEKEIAKVEHLQWLEDVSSDGKLLLYEWQASLFVLPLGETPSGHTKQSAPKGVQGIAGRFSPDGRWIVYDASIFESTGIYVQPTGGSGFRKQVAEAGQFPVWRADGKEIFFLKYGPKSELCVMPVNTSSSEISVGEPRCLFAIQYALDWAAQTPYDVTRDGSRILIPQPLSSEQPDVVHVMADWTSVLKQ